jgi:hypothetical protein
MDKEKMKRKLEQQSVRDQTNMRNWRRQRLLRYESVLNNPVLPRFCMICFFGMLVATAVMVSFDIYASMTYLSHLGAVHMLRNAATSGLFCWLLFAVVLVPCSLYQLHKGFEDPYFEKFAMKRNGKPRMPMVKRFKMYVMVSTVGTAVFLALYLLAGILS